MLLSRKKDMVTKMDEIGVELNILEVKKQSLPSFFNNLCLFFLSISLALFLLLARQYWYSWVPPIILAFIIFIIKTVKMSMINRNIRQNSEKKQKGDKEIQSNEEVIQLKSFIKYFRNKGSSSKRTVIKVVRSIPLRIFDFIFRMYNHNSKAIICKSCGKNLGLSDNRKAVKYICPCCNCNEEGVYCELEESEDEEESESIQENKEHINEKEKEKNKSFGQIEKNEKDADEGKIEKK